MSQTEYEDIIQCGQIEARHLLDGWTDEDHKGVDGVINLAHNIEPQMVYHPWLPVLHHPAWDQMVYPVEWFVPIIAFYDWIRTQSGVGRVIVHCQAGGNRSRGVFGVLLVARHGKNAPEALAITGPPGYHHWREAIENYAMSIGR